MANSWAILHDPEEYPQPEKFFPDRFLKEGEMNSDIKDPSTAAFGYGRRICPGRYFADNVLFLTVASVLSVFTFRPSMGPNGTPEMPEVKMSSGSLSFPEPFKCIIEPRSLSSLALIHD